MLPATVDTIEGFMAEAEAAPEELSSIANVMRAPPMPFVPEEAHGKLAIMALMTYAGDIEAGQEALAPFRALAEPLADMLRPMPYPEVYPPEPDDYHPVATAHTMFVDTIGRPEAETILEHLATSTAMMGVAQLRTLGGAMARVPVEATAFAHRQSRIMVNCAAVYERPDEIEVHGPWVEGFASALKQEDDGAYVNFLGFDGEARIRDAYPGATWDRLRKIKARYDRRTCSVATRTSRRPRRTRLEVHGRGPVGREDGHGGRGARQGGRAARLQAPEGTRDDQRLHLPQQRRADERDVHARDQRRGARTGARGRRRPRGR
jgi:hypothetical protein